MNHNPKIAIIGGTIWGNRGAEAMLVTTIGRIRKKYPSAEFFVFSYYPVADCRLVNEPGVHILSGKPVSLVFQHFFGAMFSFMLQKFGLQIPSSPFFQSALALSEADLLLDIGGITFSDGREKFLPFNILTILPAMILGAPVLKLAQAVGPFQHTLNRIAARFMLFRCSHIFARGERSMAHLEDLKYPADKMDLVADIAFCYQPTYSLSDENQDHLAVIMENIMSARQSGRKVIVISPSVVVDEKLKNKKNSYAQMIVNLINQLVSHNYYFIFMPNATREGSSKKHNNDLIIIQEINDKMTAQGFTDIHQHCFINFDINTAAIREIIASADLLLTSRYHAMISGLALSVPTLVIGWGHKYQETMALFDMHEYVLDFTEGGENIQDMLLQMLAEADAIRARLSGKQEKVIQLAETQFTYLDKALS